MPQFAELTTMEWNSKSWRVQDYTYQVPRGDVYSNVVQKPLTSRDIPRVGALYAGMSFGFQMAGSGTKGTPPGDGPLLTACALKHVNVPATSDTYSVTGDLDTDFTAYSIFGYPGGNLKDSCLNSAGNVSWEFMPGQPVIARYDFAGEFADITSSPVTAPLGTSARPVCAKGLALTLKSKTIVPKRIGINLNNTLDSPRYNIAGTHGVSPPLVVNQQPSFEVTLELPALTDIAFITDFVAETKHTLHIVLGSVAGNIITIDCDGYMNAMPQITEGDGLIIITATYDMSWIDGDTKLQFVYT